MSVSGVCVRNERKGARNDDIKKKGTWPCRWSVSVGARCIAPVKGKTLPPPAPPQEGDKGGCELNPFRPSLILKGGIKKIRGGAIKEFVAGIRR